MKIILAGGRGHLGSILEAAFTTEGHQVVILSRRGTETNHSRVHWDGVTLGPWTEALERADAVINLAGRSIDCRYTPHRLAEMLSSRLHSTTVIGQAIAACRKPPRVWLQASTATIYAHRFDAPNDEETGILGGDEPGAPAKWRASIAIARGWEEAWAKAETPRTRKVALRTAMVMSPLPGGVFDVLAKLACRGLGGPSGPGRQFVSWIHDYDFVAAVRWLLEGSAQGVVNICAPEPLPNAEFMRALRDELGVRMFLPAPPALLELGAWLLRTETELLLKSRRVVPRRLLEAGFSFSYPRWPDAVSDLVARWKVRR